MWAAPAARSWLAGATLAVVAGAVCAAETLYRYTNDEGVLVIHYTVPPEFVNNGYDVLNTDGSLREVVPRGLTEEERESRAGELETQRQQAEEAERLQIWDDSLMRRYSSIADIEAARDRELRDLDVRISILRSTVRSLKKQVEGNQVRAADIERGGGQVPEAILSAISGLQGEIGETERSIEERLLEVDTVEDEYSKDINRFTELLDKVELRRRYSRPGND
jgi:hypothetical protein